MSTFAHVTLEVRAAGMAKFMAAMGEATPILEGHGWRLAGAFVQRTGRLNTVIDLWELEDFGHFDRALKAFIADPRFPAIKAVLDETVLSETIVFADRAPYMR
ncbi:MAG: NIPSNAP family protein [Proteobacteria bacterium]|nr:NIPSNAP family protein [Pseudomonadota bacterium]